MAHNEPLETQLETGLTKENRPNRPDTPRPPEDKDKDKDDKDSDDEDEPSDKDKDLPLDDFDPDKSGADEVLRETYRELQNC